ncbi:glycosyltransferase family 2 protein [Candidatus Gottesmanbacteria bacterium]|nr:glycosyltransferase family 2 protein [Candidatus Gottesmanbacteria bacterium]
MTKLVYPKVSFIIPTLNAGHILPRCLSAIRSQKYPTQLVEIIIADGGSVDNTIEIAKSFRARIIVNPEILHEPGKDRASKIAKGEIFFFTDADNILENNTWLINMVRVYIEEPEVVGFLPQTIPAQDSISLDRYLGYLSTDPFTWFIYQDAASPRDYKKMYTPIKLTNHYELYNFTPKNHPLIGLTQGFGTRRSFKRGTMGHADDILAMIKLLEEKGTIAYVPAAGICHYHVSSLNNFINKYRWRVRNNLRQDISGMGLVNRLQYYNSERKNRMYLFLPYAFTFIGPVFDTLRLIVRYKDVVLLWHPIATFLIATIILWEHCFHLVHKNQKIGAYE